MNEFCVEAVNGTITTLGLTVRHGEHQSFVDPLHVLEIIQVTVVIVAAINMKATVSASSAFPQTNTAA